jgi:hypothetical protein
MPSKTFLWTYQQPFLIFVELFVILKRTLIIFNEAISYFIPFMELDALQFKSFNDESSEFWFYGSIKRFFTMNPRLHQALTSC